MWKNIRFTLFALVGTAAIIFGLRLLNWNLHRHTVYELADKNFSSSEGIGDEPIRWAYGTAKEAIELYNTLSNECLSQTRDEQKVTTWLVGSVRSFHRVEEKTYVGPFRIFYKGVHMRLPKSEFYRYLDYSERRTREAEKIGLFSRVSQTDPTWSEGIE